MLNAKPRDEVVRIARETHPFGGDIRISCMSLQKETISTINSLIETLKDGQEGFRQAAEAVEDKKSEYGVFLRAEGSLAGPNGRVLSVVTIWLQSADGRFRFITLKPRKEKKS